MNTKIAVNDIPTELIHNNTTFRKKLIANGQYKGDIATMNYAWIEPGKQLDAHAHADGEEFYFFLEGSGEILVGNDWLPVMKDDFVTIPAGSLHSVKNTGDINIVFITVRTMRAS